MKKPVWIRHVLVPGGSDKDEYLHRLADFIHTLSNVERVEVLPYHTLGKFKWENLGLDYPLEGVNPPTQERIDNARRDSWSYLRNEKWGTAHMGENPVWQSFLYGTKRGHAGKKKYLFQSKAVVGHIHLIAICFCLAGIRRIS